MARISQIKPFYNINTPPKRGRSKCSIAIDGATRTRIHLPYTDKKKRTTRKTPSYFKRICDKRDEQPDAQHELQTQQKFGNQMPMRTSTTKQTEQNIDGAPNKYANP